MGAYHCIDTTCVRWRVILPSDVHAFLFPFYESRITKRKMSMRKIKNFNLFHSALFIAILSLVSMFMCVWMLFQYSLSMSLYHSILSLSINPFYRYQPILSLSINPFFLSLSTHSISINPFYLHHSIFFFWIQSLSPFQSIVFLSAVAFCYSLLLW